MFSMHWGCIVWSILSNDGGLSLVVCQEAIAHNSFHPCPLHMNCISRGDTATVFESCDHVVESEVRIGSQEHFYMETHSVRVVPSGEDGEITVYSGEQHITGIQVSMIAFVLISTQTDSKNSTYWVCIQSDIVFLL